MKKKMACLFLACVLLSTACGTNTVVENTDFNTDNPRMTTTTTNQATVIDVPILTTQNQQTQAPTTTTQTQAKPIVTQKKTTTTRKSVATEAGHVHDRVEATCEEPGRCDCGAVVESPRGHYYVAATCEEAEHCLHCGKTKGEPLGHILKGTASCTGRDQCSRCNGRVDGTELGHAYQRGKCIRCGEIEAGYVETYHLGETWLVDGSNGQWKFTVNSVTTHYHCNSAWDREHGYSGEQIVIINYTYENISYSAYGSGLSVASFDFSVYDAEGENADTYACVHEKYYNHITVGMKHTATEEYVLPNDSNEIILVVDRTFMDDVPPAKFILSVD